MKKFMIRILFISMFFIGLGAITEKIGWLFFSHETAMEKNSLTIEGARPNVKIIKVNSPKQITVRHFEFESLKPSDHCPLQMGIIFPDHFNQKTEINLDDFDSDETEIRQ